MLIHKSLLKYGYSAFNLYILEYCHVDTLISREQYFLDLIKPELNILTVAGSTRGYKHKPETIAKFKSRKKSPEELNKLRLHLKKLNSVQFTKEFRSILNEATANFNRLTKSKKIFIKNIETGEISTFNSRPIGEREASNTLNISRSTISKYMNTSLLYKKKYKISDNVLDSDDSDSA